MNKMARYCAALCGLLLIALHPTMQAQCTDSTDIIYGNAYVLRQTADQVYAYSQTWAVGNHAGYMYTWTYQTDYRNGGQIGPQTSASAIPGYVAQTWETHNVDYYGFGTYSTYTTHQAYNACNGVYMPPYSNGWSGIVTQALAVTKPYIAGGSNVWLQFYGANANSQSYYNYTLFKAYTGGAPEVPTWTFTGATQMVSTSCYQCFTVQITATPQASPACTTQVFGQFKVGNLTSSQVGIMLRGPVQQVGYYNGLHVNNTAAYQNRGYDSFWNWQINDSCGLKMDGANLHESFPQGFTFDYAAKGWGTPTANSWTTGNTGLWSDGINEWYPAGTVICPQANYTLCPIMLPPQNPLGSTVIYHGLQYVYVGNNPGTLVFSGKQAHFQDHGGYIP